MKKLAIGLMSVAFAVIAFAFTTAKDEAAKQTNYVWFEVKAGANILCNNFANVTPGDLDLVVPRSTPTSLALSDLQNAGFRITQSEAVDEFGCPISQTYVCAVGYALVEGNFQTTPIDGTDYWIPKTTAIPQIKVCRPIQ